jgi:hypothetical protein
MSTPQLGRSTARIRSANVSLITLRTLPFGSTLNSVQIDACCGSHLSAWYPAHLASYGQREVSPRGRVKSLMR